MVVTNADSRTNIVEIAENIYRINTPVDMDEHQKFSFNQYLVVADKPLLFHTGPRQLFPLVRAAVDHVLPAGQLRYIGFSHVEADECGALNAWLDVAPRAVPLCSAVAAMVSINDIADKLPHTLADGETLDLGGKIVEWIDAPHVPHGWDCGFLFERNTRTLFCGDLFTQPGDGADALTEGDILGPSEAFRMAMDYYAHTPNTGEILERIAMTHPTTLACMHGSAWRGDGATLVRTLATHLA